MSALDPTQSETWSKLERLKDAMSDRSLRSLFDADPKRFESLSWTVGSLTFDFSKQRIDAAILQQLLDLARFMEVEGRRASLFAGEPVNTSENRAALHVALRDPSDRSYSVNGEDVAPAIAAARKRIVDLAASIIDGARTGHTGQPFDRVVSIGIGGSDLGPRSAAAVLANLSNNALDVRFVASVDATALGEALSGASPEKTLFVICSKTFSTQETMANAETARVWISDALGPEAVRAHFMAVTSNADVAKEFGVQEESILPVWDWVGGRYSLWSAIGLSIACACGPAAFERMLAGAHDMDRHFETSPLDQNIPVLAALTNIWNRNFWRYPAIAVLPYDHRLRLLQSHLQQLVMESNGKGVNRDGEPVSYDTAPVVLGADGSESQHSFMQLIHQSPMVVPVEFIVALDGQNDPHRDKLIANAFAQAEALMLGLDLDNNAKDPGESHAAHKTCPGNRPSTTILLQALTPETFGALLAFYEHRTFVEGTLWGLNSFDQWGVELGKTLAANLLSKMTDGRAAAGHDSSTEGLLATYLAQRKTPSP